MLPENVWDLKDAVVSVRELKSPAVLEEVAPKQNLPPVVPDGTDQDIAMSGVALAAANDTYSSTRYRALATRG